VALEVCPFCGGTEFVEASSVPITDLTVSRYPFRSQKLFHQVCISCGSVVRAYVKQPEMWTKDWAKEQRTKEWNRLTGKES